MTYRRRAPKHNIADFLPRSCAFIYAKVIGTGHWTENNITFKLTIDKQRQMRAWAGMERELRFVYCDFQSSYKELREVAGVPILYLDRLRTSMCEVYKIINEKEPVYLQKLFTQKKT